MGDKLKSTSRILEQTSIFQHMNFSPPTQLDESQEAPSRSGQVLAIKRRELGISATEVAHRLKLSEKQVRAIEAGDFASLPEPAYIRAFVRSYAKALFLDESVVMGRLQAELDDYLEQIEAGSHKNLRKTANLGEFKSYGSGVGGISAMLTPKLKRNTNLKSSYDDKPFMSITRLLGIGMLLAAIIGVVALNSGWLARYGIQVPQINRRAPEMEVVQPAADTTHAAMTSSSKAQEVGSAPQAAVAPIVSETSAGTTAGGAVAQTPPSGAPVDNQTNSVTATVSATPTSASTVPASAVTPGLESSQALVLRFTGECWISIKNQDDVELVTGLFQAGTEKVVTEPGPYKLLLGNADTVNVSYKGQKVDLTSHVKGAVAKFKLD